MGIKSFFEILKDSGRVASFLIFMTIAFVWFKDSIEKIIYYRKSKRKECDGKIVDIMELYSNGNVTPVYSTKYEYTINDKKYTGIHETTKRYEKGMIYKIYYREDNPAEQITKIKYNQLVHSIITLFLVAIIIYIIIIMI